jgi:hypothetical protein
MQIQIQPVPLWSGGTTEADTIKFLPSIYSFGDGTLNVNYQLMKAVITVLDEVETTTYDYITGGAYTIPKDVVDEWSVDSEMYDYVIVQLGLTKV